MALSQMHTTILGTGIRQKFMPENVLKIMIAQKFFLQKNNIDCTYDLAWYLYNHNISEDRDFESIELFKSIENLDVRAAIFLTNYFSDPVDAFQFELDILNHFENFDSNYDKARLSIELTDHYNHIVKPKKLLSMQEMLSNF